MMQIFRHLVLAVTYLVLMLPAQVNSQVNAYEVSEFELHNMIESLSEKNKSVDSLNSELEIKQFLTSYSHLDQVILKHLWLNHLSYQQVISLRHQKWVQSLTNESATLSSRFSEHPEKKIVLVNIAKQARSLLKIIKIKRLVEKIEEQWLSNTFVWTEWLKGQSENYLALVSWLSQENTHIDEIKLSFEKHSAVAKLPNNKVLAILIKKSSSANLYSLLWQRKVDEFTYQVIHDLPDHYDKQLVIEQLGAAKQIKQLSSQALLSLATHYPLDPKAQKAIELSLEDPDQQWLALMALGKMDAPEFKQRLLSKAKNQQTPFAKSASKMLAHQIQIAGEME